MESYLKFFELQKSPFDAKGSGGVVLGTKALRKAFQEIKQGLEQGAPRICVGGGEGLGKTSLCRALPKLLSDSAQLVQIMNPDRPWPEVRTIIVRRLGLEGGSLSRGSMLAARGDHRYLIIAIDQAERLSREALEHLDTLMRYQDDDDRQLLHCVLFANLEAAPAGADIPLLWWLDQLTTLQLRFAPIPAQGIHHYIEKRLQKAGWPGGDLFSPQACLAIHRLTGGVPSAVNDLCERALGEASSRGLAAIGSELVEELFDETIAAALPPLDDMSFEESSPSMNMSGSLSGQSGLSAQSLLDATPYVESARRETRRPTHEPRADAPAPRSEPRPPPAPPPDPSQLELADNPFAKAGAGSASSKLELSNEPFVTPQASATHSSLELADESDLGNANSPGRGSVPASGIRTHRPAPAAGSSRSRRKPARRDHTRLLLLLLAALAGAGYLRQGDPTDFIHTLLPEQARETLQLARPPAPSDAATARPNSAGTARPGSVAAVLDAIDEAPAALPEDLPTLPLAEAAEVANAAPIQPEPQRSPLQAVKPEDVRAVIGAAAGGPSSESAPTAARSAAKPVPVQPVDPPQSTPAQQADSVGGASPARPGASLGEAPASSTSKPAPATSPIVHAPIVHESSSMPEPVVNEHLALPSEVPSQPAAAPDPSAAAATTPPPGSAAP
ncbi:MAG: hypothetical protein JRG96_04155 [Deltaproteobacteria bacterium]|nr:hypothetical protein [Deltaproteobacteria bacterium]